MDVVTSLSETDFFDHITPMNIEDLPMYDGVRFSAFPPLQKDVIKRMREIEEFKSSETDIILTGYIKSGNHWIWEILNMLVKTDEDFTKDSKESYTLEIMSDLKAFDKMKSPRILSTHLQYRFLPKIHRDNGYKIVCVVRNPKDVAVSSYHHLSRSKMSCVIAPDWPKLLSNFYSDDFLYGGWFNYVKEWEMIEMMDNKNSLLVLKYEECIKNPSQSIIDLAKFLGIECTEEKAASIAESCHIDRMKTSKFDDSHLYALDGKGLIYRKGTVGDWKNHFTVAQNETFEKIYETKMKDSSLRFAYE